MASHQIIQESLFYPVLSTEYTIVQCTLVTNAKSRKLGFSRSCTIKTKYPKCRGTLLHSLIASYSLQGVYWYFYFNLIMQTRLLLFNYYLALALSRGRFVILNDCLCLQVLNERTREVSQQKTENTRLLHQLEEEKARRDQGELQQQELRSVACPHKQYPQIYKHSLFDQEKKVRFFLVRYRRGNILYA